MDTPNTAPAPQAELTDREKSLTMFGILTAMFLAALDQSIVTPAMPTIGGQLGDAQYLPWVVTAYLLAATAVAPLYGKISDIYGRRRTLYAALGLFLLGSVIAALAPNMFVLIAGRTVQGLGGGGLFALSQILIGDMLPPRERGKYAGWIAGMWAVAGAAGPLLGGTIAELHWSLIFWLNLPLGALAFAVVNKPLKRLTIAARAHRLDYLGSVLVVAATSTLLLMLNWAGSAYAWGSPQILGLGVASLLLFVAFGVRLMRASEPLVSLEVLSSPIVLMGGFTMFMVAAANVGLAVFLPIYGQAYFDLSPAWSGYAMLGPLLFGTLGATLSGRATVWVVHVKRISIVGSLVAAAGLIAMALTASMHSLLIVDILLAIVGLGMGATYPVTTVSVQNGVDQKHLGVATGMLAFLRSLGSALGVAVLGAIALGFGVPFGADAKGQVPHIADATPFSALFFVTAGIMLAAALFAQLMPHQQLRNHNASAAPAPAVE